MKSNREIFLGLCSLGDMVPLRVEFDHEKCFQEIQAHKEHWHPYNPRKPYIKRWGMSLTSLDGGVNGVPDLDSIREYNRIHNTTYNELSFRTPTPTFKNIKSIFEPCAPFVPYLGRSHLLRLDSGGFFPYHRDGNPIDPEVFRLFAPLTPTLNRVVFILNEKVINLHMGRLYFFNSHLAHALFSFNDASLFLVMNVIVNEESASHLLEQMVSF